jgi:hypothetical protein
MGEELLEPAMMTTQKKAGDFEGVFFGRGRVGGL